jgi:putative DNA modification/repair radical SAM protein
VDTARKLEILTDAAKYDVACTSSGVDRDAKLGHLGSTYCAGICHSFSADGRCITLLKVLMTNACMHDCAYCANRRSNDIPRAAFEPRELADLTIEFYRRNYIEGLFLSSGVVRTPDYTMELMYETVRILREEHGFLGYIHVKGIPGASSGIIDRMGYLVDRMSVNIELPSQESLSVLAPGKTKAGILSPMGHLAQGIAANRDGRLTRRSTLTVKHGSTGDLARRERTEIERLEGGKRFVPAGQSTQLIVGATPESDYHILNLSASLYRMFELKRVFFSAYLPINDSSLLPDKSVEAPLTREHRLYQADWLMRFYEFTVDELIDAEHPFLDMRVDPKASWALRNLDLFPIEINKAPYEMLLRVPGLGVVGARKVMRARRHCRLRHEDLVKMGLSIKRMRYFITCNGSYASPVALDETAIRTELMLMASPAGKGRRSGGKQQAEGQLALFDPHTGSEAMAGHMLGEDQYGASPFQEGQLQAFAQQRALLAAAASRREVERIVVR